MVWLNILWIAWNTVRWDACYSKRDRTFWFEDVCGSYAFEIGSDCWVIFLRVAFSFFLWYISCMLVTGSTLAVFFLFSFPECDIFRSSHYHHLFVMSSHSLSLPRVHMVIYIRASFLVSLVWCRFIVMRVYVCGPSCSK
jgi:hypothetical protein